MMPVVEVLKTIQELVCSYFSEEQFTLSEKSIYLTNQSIKVYTDKVKQINQALK